ncbi:MAG: alanine/glycine:cation symporter family protein [Prochloraceae cyanobacterium]|nr:alanine/glycine:cation symporter family protein [Prochloraceae cyanobacterium]
MITDNWDLSNLLVGIDAVFSGVVAAIQKILFFSIGGMPLIILWIVAGGIFCTLRMGFINIRGFKHAIDIARGKYDNLNNDATGGEVTAFQALATALSGTIGLGNIAGVAIAIQMGGPGAVFWMTLAAILGMSSKFVECTLGMKYRNIKPDGSVSGGPMYYLAEGLSQRGMSQFGRILAVFFAVFCIGASFGGGNMFQVNQSFAALATVFPQIAGYNWLYGILVAFLVGLVIVGGISRIGVVTSRLVPAMVVIYLAACVWVLAALVTEIPAAFATIVREAFDPLAIEGGIVGVLVQGVRRSAFSNGAGLGSAAIAHSAAKTEKPIQEGIVAVLEPFIDTVVICNLTALAIVITGMYGDRVAPGTSGSELTATAFASVLDWFPLILSVVIVLFGFSTLITWSYYGQQCWGYLFGEETTLIYKGIFLFFIFIGAVVNLGAVVDFSDMMLLAMSVPNLIGCVILSNEVAKDLKQYWLDLNDDRSALNSPKVIS